MEMPIRKFLCLLLFLPWLTAFTHIPQGATQKILEESGQGQQLIFDRKYGEAQEHFHRLWREYPDSPLGTFGIMVLYNAIMFENYDFSLDKSFAQVSYSNETIVDKIAKNEDSSAWDNFLCGASAGLRAFYLIRQDKALAALGQANIADKCLSRAQAKDPKFKDVLLGQGMSLYWRSVFTQSFGKILPFFKDQRPEGINLMKQAVNESILAGDLSRVSLMFVYLNDHKNRDGLALANELVKKYPKNLIAQLHQGRFLLYTGQIKRALAIFQKIYQQDPKITVTWFFQGQAYQRLGQKEKAKAAYETFLKNHTNPAWQAYAHYNLGMIALQNHDEKAAMAHFKAGHNTYGHYKPNLNMILKLRKERT